MKDKTLENILRFVMRWDTDSTGNHSRIWLEGQIGNQLQHLWQEAYEKGYSDARDRYKERERLSVK